MNESLPMPSDVKKSEAENLPVASQTELVEPPSAKLIVRLFLIPLIIVALAVGVMYLIGQLAGGKPSFEEALARLRQPGGERTAEVLVGPGSKQRYMDAKTVADKLMKTGATDAERAKISDDIVEIIEKFTNDREGDVRHFLLLALGRAWQIPNNRATTAPAPESPATAESRQRALATLLKFANSGDISNQKAAILALAYWAGREEVRQAVPVLISKVTDETQDIDVRIAAATVLGPISRPGDADVIAALQSATRATRPEERELVWSSALSLAQLNQPDVADTILKLLDRDELSRVEVLDRETDPKNPTFHTLGDQEQQRILINTMIGAKKLNVPAVQEKLRWLKEHDPSPRVRAAAVEVLEKD